MNSVFPFSSRLLIRFSSIPVSHLQLSGGPPLRRLACPCRAGRCCYTSPVEYNHYPAPFPPGLPSLDSPSLIVQPSLFFHYSVHASHLFRGQWMPALKDAAGMTRIVRLRQTMRPLPLDGMHAIELKSTVSQGLPIAQRMCRGCNSSGADGFLSLSSRGSMAPQQNHQPARRPRKPFNLLECGERFFVAFFYGFRRGSVR